MELAAYQRNEVPSQSQISIEIDINYCYRQALFKDRWSRH